MCGILGGTDLGLNYKKGIKSLQHRGPNGEKIITYANSNVTMAFARLSIIDLSENAMQPMSSQNGHVHIVFNGEIYGYQALRNNLKGKYNFKTSSDTEVILALYSLYGDTFIDKLDGMFAIAIYDERENKIKLYRDRAGIKPLYYYWDEQRFLFASELKAIESTLNNANLEIDSSAIYDYLSYGYIPEPKSIYKNVSKLKPATMLVFDLANNNIEQIKRFWKLHVNTRVDRKRKKEDICDQFKSLMQQSIKDQMIADVPVGTFFSGGIDSSIVTYECMKFNKNIQTFSMGFEEKNYSEIKYVTMLAKQLNINANIEILSKNCIKELYKEYKNWYDEPYADTSAFPTYLVSKNAVENVTVVLTGDGGDELFGGYERYTDFAEHNLTKKRTRFKKIGDLLVHHQVIDKETWQNEFESEFEYYAGLMGCESDFFRVKNKKLFGLSKDYDEYWALRKYYNKDLPKYTRARYLDFKTYLPGDILTKVDRAVMAVSLEARVPFLSRSMIEFAFSLSQEECNTGGGLKQMLKDAYTNLLPHEILYRRKKGFSIPPRYIPSLSPGLTGTRQQLLHDLWLY